MNKKFAAGLTALAVAAVGLAWWWQNKTPPAPMVGGATPAASEKAGGKGGGGPVAVEVGTIRRLRLVDEAVAIGTISSRRSVMLRPEVGGRVSALGFEEGRPVRQGQLLVQLDDTVLRAQLRQAQAQAELARSQWQRNRDLAAQSFVSQNAVDQSGASHEVAVAQVALVEAQLARTRILAPFDGVAGIRRVNQGDYVKDGADLVDIQDLSQLWVDFRLGERYLPQLKPGLLVEVRLDAQPDVLHTAKIEALDSQVDANGRSLLIRARLDSRDRGMKPGTFARARTIFGVREDALMAPEAALVPQGGKQYLVKVVDGENGKTAQRIEARIGARIAGSAEILEGVQEGDQVVTAGQERLMRGDAQVVRIVTLGRSPGSASAPSSAKAAAAASGPSSAAKGGVSARPAV